jgi:hypothetical protein
MILNIIISTNKENEKKTVLPKKNQKSLLSRNRTSDNSISSDTVTHYSQMLYQLSYQETDIVTIRAMNIKLTFSG